jgi:vitamin B12 transporter
LSKYSHPSEFLLLPFPFPYICAVFTKTGIMIRSIPVVLLFIGLATQLIHAQTDSNLYQLPDVTVKENRIQLPFSENSRNIQIISAEQIEKAPVVSVAELLHYVAGVDVRQRGVHGVQADISIRGGTFDQTLILINGVKMIDPQTGHHAMNLPVDLEHIERIEVLKGPGARVFGQNAFAGAINIITKTPEEAYVGFQIQGGQNEMGGIRLSASLPRSNFKQYFSMARDFSQGYRPNTDYNITNLFYQSGFSYVNTELKVLAGFTERAFGANGFYASPQFTEQYEEIQTSLLSVELETKAGDWTFVPRFYWRRNQDEYIFVRSNPSLYRNLHIGNVVGAEFNATYDSDFGMSGAGLDVQSVYLRSNNLGTRERQVISAFLEHRLEWWDGRLDITPGLLFNYFTDFGTNLFPGIDLGVAIHPQLKIYANAGNTYRVPTFTDLYYEDQANVGNPDLLPESAFTWEAGIKGQWNGLRWQAGYFDRQGMDLIDWTKEVDTLQWQPQNFGRVNMRGLDASLEMYFPALFKSDHWLQRFQIGYTYIDAEKLDTEVAFSRYALENLRHQFTSQLEYRILPQLTHSLHVRYSDRVNLDDFTVVDTRFTYGGDKARIFVEATNLFDVAYQETNLVPMPGRWIRGGINWKFLVK